MNMMWPAACVLYKNIVSQLQYYYSREIKQQLFRFFIYNIPPCYHHILFCIHLSQP